MAVKASLAALDSAFPPSAFPFARSTTAPRSAAGVVTGHACAGQRAEQAAATGQDDRPDGDARASVTMNQVTFSWGDQSTRHDFKMAVSEQPQQRLESFGVKAVSDTELLAIILQGSGTCPEQAVSIASRLLAQAGSIVELAGWKAADYRRVKGIGQIKGLQLVAIAEIARRMMTSQRIMAPCLDAPEHIAAHFAPIVLGLEVEKFWVLLLNRKNRLIRQVEVTSGTATASLVHPREVFRPAFRESAPVSAIVCVHNHPSGSPEPSAADVRVTRTLREAARTIEIELLDHVIVGNREADANGLGYYSFRDAGIL